MAFNSAAFRKRRSGHFAFAERTVVQFRMPEIYRESQGFALAEIRAGQLALFENGALQMDSFQVGNHETA